MGQLAYENYKKCFVPSRCFRLSDVLEIRDDFWFKAIGGLQGGGNCGLTCGALSTGFVLINARVGRARIDQGIEAIFPAFEPSHQLAPGSSRCSRALSAKSPVSTGSTQTKW